MASTGLTTALTRPVRGSIATTAPPARPSARWQACPTARSQVEALAGRITEGNRAGATLADGVRCLAWRLAAVAGETTPAASVSTRAGPRDFGSESRPVSTP